MAQFSRGITFIDGTSGHTAAEIHSLIDNAHILPAFITDQTLAVPVDSDKYIFVQSSTNTLKSITHRGLVAALPSDAAATKFSLRRLGTGALMACAGNDSRLRNSITGFRIGQGAGVDRAATASDFKFAQTIPANNVINWSLANVFSDTLTTNETYTMNGGAIGRQVTIILKLQGHTATVGNITNLATLGTGTTWARFYLTQTAIGIVGFCVYS